MCKGHPCLDINSHTQFISIWAKPGAVTQKEPGDLMATLAAQLSLPSSWGAVRLPTPSTLGQRHRSQGSFLPLRNTPAVPYLLALPGVSPAGSAFPTHMLSTCPAPAHHLSRWRCTCPIHTLCDLPPGAWAGLSLPRLGYNKNLASVSGGSHTLTPVL